MLEVLFLLGDVWGLVFGDSLWRVVSGLISGGVLGVCIRVAIGLVGSALTGDRIRDFVRTFPGYLGADCVVLFRVELAIAWG